MQVIEVQKSNITTAPKECVHVKLACAGSEGGKAHPRMHTLPVALLHKKVTASWAVGLSSSRLNQSSTLFLL